MTIINAIEYHFSTNKITNYPNNKLTKNWDFY